MLSRVKGEQQRHWDRAAAGWKKWQPVLEPMFAPVSEALMDLAGIAPGGGAWVLDVACGIGDTSFAIARRVGARGRVVGIDLAPGMLAVAEERARRTDVRTVGFRELDAEALGGWPEAAYEAAVSRFGLMFLPDLDVAARGVHHVLTPDGHFAAAVWGDADSVPYMTLARRAAAAVLGEAAVAPRPALNAFSLARPGRLEQALSSAGFRDIQGERLPLVMDIPSPAVYVEIMRDLSSLGPIIDEQTAVEPAEVWRAVEQAVEGKLPFVCEVRLVAGRKR